MNKLKVVYRLSGVIYSEEDRTSKVIAYPAYAIRAGEGCDPSIALTLKEAVIVGITRR